jgi:hypothetical protein
MNIDQTIMAVEAVFGSFAATDGCDPSEIEALRSRGIVLPMALERLYLRTGRHPLHRAHNHLVAPLDLRVGGECLVFYLEHQGISEWGIPNELICMADPAVHTSVRRRDGGREFAPEFDSVSAFLAFQAAWQAVDGALPFVGSVVPFGGSATSDAANVALVRAARLDQLGTRLATTTAAEVWCDANVIAVRSVDGHLSLAALSEARFMEAQSLIGIGTGGWSYCSLRDGL